MKPGRNWAVWAIWMSLGIGIILTILCGCSHLTVAPEPVVATQIAFDGNTQNAGLIDCAEDGCLVTKGWMDRYQALEREFNHAIGEDIFIKPEGKNFRVSYEVTNHFIDLQRSHRSLP